MQNSPDDIIANLLSTRPIALSLFYTSFSLLLYFFVSLSLSHSFLTLCSSLYPLSRSPPFYLYLCLSLSLDYSLSFSLPPTYSLSLAGFMSLSLSRFLSLSLSLSHTHSHKLPPIFRVKSKKCYLRILFLSVFVVRRKSS